MMRNDIITVVAICLFAFLINVQESKAYSKHDEVEGYFWRDYAGFIPHDAFPGGSEKGQVTYIGQVLFNNLLIPAKIIQSEEKAYFEWGLKEHTTEENIKILCTDNPEKLRWLSTSKSDFNNVKRKRLINGGFEPNSKLYIGRTNKTGDTLLGKLLVNDGAILHTTQDGKNVETKEFEVLYYYDPQEAVAVDTKGYYWRDYSGFIPSDAFPAGVENKKITFIVQVLYNGLLVPGKISEAERKAEFEWGLQAHSTTEDIKIFCTDKPEHFHWLKTNKDDFKKIKDKRFVVASREGNGVLYIGRALSRANKIVGKLLVNEDVILHTAEHGRSMQSTEFEVLYYDPPMDELLRRRK